MPDIASHYRLLAVALPSEEKRIRTSYVPTLVLVVVASGVVFVAGAPFPCTIPALACKRGLYPMNWNTLSWNTLNWITGG